MSSCVYKVLLYPLTYFIQHAQAKPEGYVLKPQLEGGGGNFYGDEVRKRKLKLISNPLGVR